MKVHETASSRQHEIRGKLSLCSQAMVTQTWLPFKVRAGFLGFLFCFCTGSAYRGKQCSLQGVFLTTEAQDNRVSAINENKSYLDIFKILHLGTHKQREKASTKMLTAY